MTPCGERSGAGGRTCRVRPGEKGYGENALGGLVWVLVGLTWARYFARSLPNAAAAAAAGEAPVGRAGFVPRFRCILGAAAWPAEAVARLAGAAVATPHAPSPLPSAAAAALGDPPGSCAGATPRVGGVPEAAVVAAAWLAGAPVSALRASGAPGGRVCCLSGGGGHLGWLRLLGRQPGVSKGCPGLSSRRPDRHRRFRQPPLLALRGGLPRPFQGERGSRSRTDGGGSRPSGEPSESDITVILVGMRGGRCALFTTSRCISVGPWAVLCSALRGGEGEGVGGRLWRQPRTGGRLLQSIGIGRRGGGATRPTRRATAPSLGRGSGPWAPGGRQVVPGGAALGGPP